MIYSRRSYNINPLVGVIFFIGFLVMVYYLLKGFFYVVYFGAPLIVLGVLIVDYRLFVDHFKKLIVNVKREPLTGALWFIINILALPIVALWLLMIGILKRKVRKAERQTDQQRMGEYVSYEIVEDDKLADGDKGLSEDPKSSYWK